MREFAQRSTLWDESIFDEPPLPDDFIKEFLGYQVQPNADGGVRTSPTIRGFLSAIKWWYNTLSNIAAISKDMDN
jgi:hypothetical protein